MKPQLKPLNEQVIVITGASSGHGLATAKMAAEAGARVVMVARDEDALRRCRDEIRAGGGTAEYFAADVGNQDEVDAAAEFAIRTFGGFDSWVNNAGIGVYAKAEETAEEDHRRIFDTNYWGVVHGSLAAVKHLKGRDGGGALVNVGSINSDMPSPLLSSYSATKHAVKGFTDSLRLELIADEAPVSVTLIKPSAIDTPFPEHARNLTGHPARMPRPVYAPEVVAAAILDAVQTGRRSVTVGGSGKIQVLGATMLPWLFDWIASGMDGALLDKSRRIAPQEGNLFEPKGNDGQVRGDNDGRGFSSFTAAHTHPGVTLASVGLLAAAEIGIGYALTRGRSA